MTNPWLTIPASDYEGHMNEASVAQLAFLASVFKQALTQYDSHALAYLGCATGNGLEYIDSTKTKELSVIDINPHYLEIVKSRYFQQLPFMKVIEADLNNYEAIANCYSLIFAGLLFEYIKPAQLLHKIVNWLTPDGVLVVVLQLEQPQKEKISQTNYSSLNRLESIMRLITANEFKQFAKINGLHEIKGNICTLKSGKKFYVGAYSAN
ncbi:class I SAM-dependent methyltransferase [Celerinatantimonas sp. MCCC 1A17872]|uniref:class I SAM-dependent methyltransferase n=1 Tax=Celerinatantimonas sp. MCCC 1A17872 TaxID=3177514 RepID=UPI0038C5536F